MILALVFLVAIIIILHLIIIREKVTELVPLTQKNSSAEFVRQQACQVVNYSYSTVWLGWADAPQGVLNPVLNLTNQDTNAGRFAVQFGFFIESETPYELFNGRLLFKDARFVGPRQEVWLEPNQTKTISIPTNIKFGTRHWAIGYISPPNHEVCESSLDDYSELDYYTTRIQEREYEERFTLFEWIFGFSLF